MTTRKPHDNEFIVKQLRMESQDEHEDGYHGRGNLFSDAADAIESMTTTDTWTSGKILPVPENDRLVADDYLAIRKDAERVTIETFWHDIDEWRDENDNPITVSAWRRIPMDGIDAAVAEGDRP